MRNARKRLSLLLALALVFACLPQMTLPAQAAEEYNIWIGGVRVDSSNAGDVLGDGTVVFTPASGSEQARLTLNNAAIPGAARPDAPNSIAGIYAGIDLTLELVGSSEITGTDAISSSFGILLDGKTLTVTGSGTLDVTAGDGVYSCAISTNSMIIRSGTIRATAGKASGESEGVYSNSFTMEGGTLVATGGEAPDSWGVGGRAAMNGGTVTAIGQTRAFYREPDLSGYADPDVRVNTEADYPQYAEAWNGTDALGGDGSSFQCVIIEPAGYDLWVGGVRVTEANKADVLGDGTVAFTPATESEQAKLTLNGAEIIGAPVPAWPHDSDGIYSDIDLTLELHGENTVTANDAWEGGDCLGIFAGDCSLIVTGDGILNVTTGEGRLSCGVDTFVMTMHSGTLRVTAGKATETSDGVYSLFFTMEGGTLITEAGEAPESWGFVGQATINGGTIEATGQSSALYIAPKLSGDAAPAVMVNTEPTEIGAKAWNGTDDLSKDGSFKYVKIARYNPFTDVAEDAFYYDAVLWAVGHEPQITNGTSPTTFSPNAVCTRGQVVTFLWRAAGAPEPTMALNPFSDVKEGAFYYKAVLWAVQTGITKGVDATHFGPDRDCTRGQVVAFLHRAQGTPAPGSDVNPFVDVKEGAFYYDAVLWAVEKNVTKGTSETTFSPDATCTRGQIVTFLYRAMK
jgi:S-layer homology domain.